LVVLETFHKIGIVVLLPRGDSHWE